MRFHTFDLVKGGICPSGKAHVIENEKFRFWPEEGGVSDTSALEIGLGLFGDPARVAIVWLACDRVDDGTD